MITRRWRYNKVRNVRKLLLSTADWVETKMRANYLLWYIDRFTVKLHLIE